MLNKKLIQENLLKGLFVVLSVFAVTLTAEAKKKIVIVNPSEAKIFVNGMEVGNGTYTIDFKKGLEVAVLKFEHDGYVPRTVRLLKDNPKSTIVYNLEVDESWANSLGAEDGVDYANRGFDVVAKKGMNSETVWKRLMSIASNNFEDIEIRDKAAGWIRTGWKVQRFNGFAVRTRLEIKMQFTDEDEVSFRATLHSQRAEIECGLNDNCYHKFPRVMKQFTSVISELRTTLGSNL